MGASNIFEQVSGLTRQTLRESGVEPRAADVAAAAATLLVERFADQDVTVRQIIATEETRHA